MTTCPTQPGRTYDLESIYWHPCRESASPLSAHLVRRTETGRHKHFPWYFPGDFPQVSRRSRKQPSPCALPSISWNPAEHRNDSAAVRLPRGRGPYHRAGRLPRVRPAFPPRGMDYLDQVRIVRHEQGPLSRGGGPNWASGWCCFPPRRHGPTSTTLMAPTTSCCSAGNRPACRTTRSRPPPPGW